MPIKRLIHNAEHVSEFDKANNGEHFNGTCTQTSAAICLTSCLNLPTNHQALVDLLVSMRDFMFAHGQCGASGAATVVAMGAEMTRRGAKVTVYPYHEPLAVDWHALLLANAGIKPMLLQVAKAYNLLDYLGHKADAGVQYHAIAVVGIADEGYVCADPNNFGDQTLVTYPLAALVAAVPCGMVICEPYVAPSTTKPPPTPTCPHCVNGACVAFGPAHPCQPTK